MVRRPHPLRRRCHQLRPSRRLQRRRLPHRLYADRSQPSLRPERRNVRQECRTYGWRSLNPTRPVVGFRCLLRWLAGHNAGPGTIFLFSPHRAGHRFVMSWSRAGWSNICDELGGRSSFRIRRPDQSADDRLDDWLARVPATQASAPELDVHPQALLVQAKMGGGVTRLSLRITNVGFRLLRSSVRVEPVDARWVKLLAGGDGRPFQTIDQTEIPVELELPETIEGVLRAVIVIESNGGTRRVEVRVERPPDPLFAAEAGSGVAGLEAPILARELRRRLTRVSPLARLAVCCGAGAGFRLLVALMNAAPFFGSGSRLAEPRITSVAILTIAAGVLCGLILAKRRGEPRDWITAGLAGGLLGLLASAPWFSMLQAAERILGPWSTSIAAVCLLWGAFGAALALASTVFIAHQPRERQVIP